MRLHSSFAAAITVAIATGPIHASTVDMNEGISKLMIVGDSITHGHEGDFTWRYRLWEWLKGSGVAFEFVGPYTGTTAPEEPKDPDAEDTTNDVYKDIDINDYPRIEWGYAEQVPKTFDAHHFATSGYKAALAQASIRVQVEEFDPDLLLVMLGYNDLAWGCKKWTEKPFDCVVYVNADDVMISMKKFVDNARAGKPTVKFAISNIIRRTPFRADVHDNTNAYNVMLKGNISSWSTEESPIYHVDVAANYSCGPDRDCPAAFDGLHPNSLGDFEIASAFSRILATKYGLGHGAVGIPGWSLTRPLPPPTLLRAEGTPTGAVFTWDRIYGITEYDVELRVNEQDWLVSKEFSNRSDTLLRSSGVKVDYRLRSCYGLQCGNWSEIVSTKTGSTAAPLLRPDGTSQTPTVFSSADGLLGVFYISLLLAVGYVMWRFVTRAGVKGLISSIRSGLTQRRNDNSF